MTNSMKPVALATAIAAATLAVGTTAASAQAEVTLRCQHFLSPMGSVPRFFIEPWAEKPSRNSPAAASTWSFIPPCSWGARRPRSMTRSAMA
jgi:hypothetical protein